MKKRIVTIALVIALLATCFAGTYAYLMDDDYVANTMTLGEVAIEQVEYERNAEGKLVAFTQNKPLYPAVNPSMKWADETVTFSDHIEGAAKGGQKPFVEPNALDKFVFVKNTGKSAAFVRTLIAFEAGSKTQAEHDELIGISYHDATWTIGEQVYTTIGGKNYVVIEFVYTGRADDDDINGILPPDGQVTTASLCQIYMASSATNEDVKDLDGDNDGYDVIALSQAVQAQGFANAQTALDTAFGKVDETNATKWFEALN